jgi:hypothetical protein
MNYSYLLLLHNSKKKQNYPCTYSIIKAYEGIGFFLILTLDTRWWCTVSITLLPLYPQE